MIFRQLQNNPHNPSWQIKVSSSKPIRQFQKKEKIKHFSNTNAHLGPALISSWPHICMQKNQPPKYPLYKYIGWLFCLANDFLNANHIFIIFFYWGILQFQRIKKLHRHNWIIFECNHSICRQIQSDIPHIRDLWISLAL